MTKDELLNPNWQQILPQNQFQSQQPAANTAGTTAQPAVVQQPQQAVAQPPTPQQLQQEYQERNAAEQQAVVQPNPAGNSAGTTATTQVQQQTTAAAKPQPMDYDAIISALNKAYPVETPAEEKARKRRERSQAIVSAIGDGISALSNLYFTTQGSPNAYNPTNALSPQFAARRDAMRKERETNKKAYWNAYTQLMKQKNADERDYRLQEYREQRLKAEAEKEERLRNRLELDQMKQEWQQKYQQGLLDDKAERRRIEEWYKAGLISLKQRDLYIRELNAETARFRAETAAAGKTVERTETGPNGEKTIKTTTTPNRGSSGGGGGETKKPLPTGKKALP